ncbi:hypothetical protein HELRODRAFT_159332 [Helobdella robusta]|uniref:Uncharacterized protein n=1 Tax=Helobdella robusta TaxID=6412 RepID=T1ENW3_HELRO|nr:hypothetical protein HELRODRAFT_159332 [Helobdella robusta]ESO12749.1 hypothetical protein HELRODRAFT_159332 [Helobdella robusta]
MRLRVCACQVGGEERAQMVRKRKDEVMAMMRRKMITMTAEKMVMAKMMTMIEMITMMMPVTRAARKGQSRHLMLPPRVHFFLPTVLNQQFINHYEASRHSLTITPLLGIKKFC